ncbi:hypothetical protein [Nocardiopsis alba]|uniref:hypothetical protein n=1 Tax=Nocardiopsis alba TaxID=53437 RepID=UPI003D70C913
MARLRTLHIGTETHGDARREQHVLVLDDLTPEQADATRHATLAEGMPPILVFDFSVDLPGPDIKNPDLNTPADQQAVNLYTSSSQVAAEAIRNLENQVFAIHDGILSRLEYLEERTST